MGKPGVRHPAVAGTFYPGDAAGLRRAVTGYLEEAGALQAAGAREAANAEPPGLQPTSSEGTPKALIVPHAGFIYSGPVAASAYVRIEPMAESIRRVVLLGPSHRIYLEGLAATSADRFATPLGEIPIDRESLRLALGRPQVHTLDAAHAEEHSLEVQLPFLQHLLSSFELVPFSVGDASTEEVCEVIELLWGGEETLIIISSDLSHYEDYDEAKRMDAATSGSIEALRPDDLDSESACGRAAVRGMLKAASNRGLHARTVDLRNSGDTAGPRDRVVGYGAYVFA